MKLARTRGMTDLRDPHLVSEPIPLQDFPPMARPAPYLRSPLSVEVAGGIRRVPGLPVEVEVHSEMEVHLEDRPLSRHSLSSGLVMVAPTGSPPRTPCPLEMAQGRRQSKGSGRLQMFW